MSYRKRIVLLPGFGEDKRIFRKLKPYLHGYDLLHVDYRSVLHLFSPEDIIVEDFVAALHAHYSINKEDILIGHSLGGYISHVLRQQLGCDNCLIASFTETKKIKLPFNYKKLVKWFTNKGFFTSPTLKQLIRLKYHNKPSMPEIENSLEVIQQYGKEDIYKLIRMIQPRSRGILDWLRSKPAPLRPSLILHPVKDLIVARPSEPHIPIPGDHFSHATHPEIVGGHIAKWLLRLKREKAHELEMQAELEGANGFASLVA